MNCRVLNESTVKATFNTPYELLWGLSGEEARSIVRKFLIGDLELASKRILPLF